MRISDSDNIGSCVLDKWKYDEIVEINDGYLVDNVKMKNMDILCRKQIHPSESGMFLVRILFPEKTKYQSNKMQDILRITGNENMSVDITTYSDNTEYSNGFTAIKIIFLNLFLKGYIHIANSNIPNIFEIHKIRITDWF